VAQWQAELRHAEPSRWPSARVRQWPGAWRRQQRVGGVGCIGEQVHDNVCETYGEDTALYESIVAIGDGGKGETAEAWPAEDGLGDDGASQQRAELEPDNGEDRIEGVAESVSKDDRSLR